MHTMKTASGAGEYLKAVGVVSATTALCLVLRPYLATIDVAMVLLLGVVLVAGRYTEGPSVLASLLSIAAFNFLFVPPYYTLSVFDRAYYLTFGVMLVVALAMSRLTSRIRQQREAAAARERRMASRYALESDLSAATNLDTVCAAIAGHLGRAVAGTATVHLAAEVGAVRAAARAEAPTIEDTDLRVATRLAWEQLAPAGWGTPHVREAAAMVVPLHSGDTRLGVVIIRPSDPAVELSLEQHETLPALVELAAAALDRRLLALATEQARSEGEAERLRTALLSSLSHDLRTPLAGIEGSASSLLEESARVSDSDRRELLEGIVAESRRMTRLVGNLLDMVRVETGLLAVQRSWQPLEEALGVALLRMEDRLGAHPVSVHVPQDLPMVPIDELLIENVLLNLLENAVRYTPPGTPIEISAHAEPDRVIVEVSDRGPGVPAGAEELMFERFRRGGDSVEASTGAGAGSGLGLTICRGIITAHGGEIWMEPRPGGGTTVRFTLPLSDPLVAPLPDPVTAD